MISLVAGNLFTSPARVLVNTVNTVGVMGKGIAKTFKTIFPEMFKEYQHLCDSKQLQIGNLWLYKTSHKWVLNFPTKKDWRHPSKPEYIEAGLKKFVLVYSELGITSIAFPKLGCGNGELDWEKTVKPLMLHYLSGLPLDIYIYDVDLAVKPLEHNDIQLMNTWLRSEPRSLPFSEMWRDLAEAIGNGKALCSWDSSSEFITTIKGNGESGLVLQFDQDGIFKKVAVLIGKLMPDKWRPRILEPGKIFVPAEAMVDLWQKVRAYGFCAPSTMPEHLESLSECLLPVLDLLDYMHRTQLAPAMSGEGSLERALQLFTYPAMKTEMGKQELDAVQLA